jgi:hypothetical protein
MRAGMDRLAALVQLSLGINPFDGAVCLFRGRKGRLVIALWHDGVGLCLLVKAWASVPSRPCLSITRPFAACWLSMAASFMFAVQRWPEAWRPMVERGGHVALMLPIIACDATREVERLLQGRPEPLAHVAQACHHIPEAVRAIRAYWRQHAP